jgi:undecaprenyl diphosphate synthase
LRRDTVVSKPGTGSVPKHVAIIMDGNGRWATRQGLPRLEGHRRGYEALREIVRAAPDLGIEALTVYAFSSENWSRPVEEVHGLMALYAAAAQAELPNLQQNNVRMTVSGRLHEIPEATRRTLSEVTQATRENTRLVLNLALNYGGRNEIVDAARAIAREVADGKLSPEDIDEEAIRGHLYSPWLPDPDLLIRTASEMRISNFQLWEIAYAEIWVTDVLWPEFTPEVLGQAVEDYAKRTRKFGAVVEEKSREEASNMSGSA